MINEKDAAEQTRKADVFKSDSTGSVKAHSRQTAAFAGTQLGTGVEPVQVKIAAEDVRMQHVESHVPIQTPAGGQRASFATDGVHGGQVCSDVPLPVGKLDSDVLQNIVLDRISYRRAEVKTRAGVGEDCAVVDFGAYDCVVSTDPITAAVSEIGRLAIHISCNDIASNGIEPLGITLAVMLPVGTTVHDVECIMTQAGEAAAAAGVEIIGGHTEVTQAVNQPVIVSTAFGRALSDASQSAHDMKSGDYVFLTKWAGMEGTGIIASDFEAALTDVLTAEELTEARSLLKDVSVVKEGVAAGKIGTGGMHDVTEGGILGAVWEMCHIAGLGAVLWEDCIPLHPSTVKIAAHFGLHPLRLISSGCMMVVAAPEKKEALMAAIGAAGVPISCIGQILPPDGGLHLVRADGAIEEITPPEPDELYKVVK